MNVRYNSLDIKVEKKQLNEAVLSLIQSIIFQRTGGKFKYDQETEYSVGAVGYQDVDCDTINLSYISSSSKSLNECVKNMIENLTETLKKNFLHYQTQQISLEFYQRKKKLFWPTECVPWEVWNITIQLITFSYESDSLVFKETLGEILSEKIINITDSIHKHDYLPLVPKSNELDLVFDTSFFDVQPYLFQINLDTNRSIKKIKNSVKEFFLL